jgi:hypothetical protein
VLLASIRTHRHFHAAIEQSAETGIRKALDSLINQIQIDLDTLSDGGFRQTDNRLNTLVRRGCG